MRKVDNFTFCHLFPYLVTSVDYLQNCK